MLERVCRKGNPLALLWGNVNWDSHYRRQHGDSLKKLGIKLLYAPTIPLLGIYPEKTKIEKDTYIPKFTEALFTITRAWKWPRCPFADEWIKNLWYIYTTEFHSARKRNTFESVLVMWMKIEPIVQSEVRQKEKIKYHILLHIYGTDEPVCRAAKETQT